MVMHSWPRTIHTTPANGSTADSPKVVGLGEPPISHRQNGITRLLVLVQLTNGSSGCLRRWMGSRLLIVVMYSRAQTFGLFSKLHFAMIW